MVYRCFQTTLLFIVQIPLLALAELHRSSCFANVLCNFCLDSNRRSSITSHFKHFKSTEERSREKIQTEYGANQRTPLCDKGKSQTQEYVKWFATSSKKPRSISTMKLEYFKYGSGSGKQEEANGHLIMV